MGDNARPAAPTFREALWYWLKLGFVSFGGPAAQISIMHHDLVEQKRWISERRFLHALNYCMLLPGPEAQQLATYIGWMMHRTWGGIIAGSLFVLPSLLILVLLAWIYAAWGQVPVVAGIFYGIKPTVTAIIVFAAWRIGSRALKNAWLWALAAAALLAIAVLDVPFPAIILGAALVGVLGGKFAPDKFATGGGHAGTDKSFGPAVIDDDTPPPGHARFSIRRLVLPITIGFALWAAAILALSRFGDQKGVLAQMGWFFTKAALLTFGGAYAVLPYVFQGAVEHHGWLTAGQMMDGLALGETTPGPLIMVVAFVGFMGGWQGALFGPDALPAAGALAAVVVTFFTFLPSFLFILAGGPLVESTHGNLKFTAPLTAITAAVVGVILNLALFFAWHLLWPHGFSGGFQWMPALMTLLAFFALFRYRLGIIPLIAAGGTFGLALSLTGTL
jgi:chromate transporter